MHLKIIKKTLISTTAAFLLFTGLVTSQAHAKVDSIIVAGGCFWCVESDFEKHKGVISAVSGYIGGHVANPTYEQVSSKKTGHYEAVKINFEDTKVSARELLDYFWKTVDPTDATGQFCDKGSPYYTGVFYQNESQKQIFNQSKQAIVASKPFSDPIVTQVMPAKVFYPAEQYHQDYYKRNPVRYNYYRWGCGRDKRIETLWGKVVSKQQ